ncbi:two-component system, chemotaxis family, sensor histidine kinase and response regulator WspE [Massilia sp. PDC64]|nr:hybrid sensor histidine kinase/response regulator [Massilia sp. PDC64]SDC87794.1 two-component system, chemotaxis family, sensor histidine kinase and response regulator WspE [Massilia sp. PDC64]
MSTDHEDLSGYSMLDLFRMETREQMRVLTEGLLLLEQGAVDGARLESMMRAAHSVKGAAAIVGLEPAVRLAHAMEDVLVAAQEGRAQLDANGVDVLLGAVDLLQQLAEADDARAPRGNRVAAMVAALGALHGKGQAAPAAPPPPPAPAPPSPPAPLPAPAEPPAAQAGSDELLTLAGQARLHAGQLRPWIAGLQRYKRHQRAVYEALGDLQDAIRATGDARLAELAQRVADRAAPLRETLHRTIEGAEHYERQAQAVSARLADEVLALRMCPFAEGVHGLPRMVRDLARGLGKDVRVEIAGADTLVDRAVLARMEAPLHQLLRNAVDHGMELPPERTAAGKPAHGTIRLEARHRGGMLALVVADDGRGVDPERIRAAAVRRQVAAPAFAAELSQAELMEFLFLPGFSLKESATELSGRGVGLDVVHDTVRSLNGTVRAESVPGAGFTTVITLPLTQSIVRALVVDVAGEAYALPIARVEGVRRVPAADVRTLHGRQYVDTTDGPQLGLVAASQVLDLGEAVAGTDVTLVAIGTGRERYGLVVDAVRGEQSLTVQPLEPTFGKLRDIAAAALLDDGTPVLILDVPDMLHSIARLLDDGAALRLGFAAGESPAGRARRVLVVDDSLTVREMQRKLLAARGYHVDVALDGLDGWNQLRGADYDLVITDIDMPRLDGIGLTERIRRDPRLARLPVMIVSYKDRPEDRARGLEAGADYYLAKGAFHDATLLDAVRDLVGGAHEERTP